MIPYLKGKFIWSSEKIAWASFDVINKDGGIIILWNDPSTQINEVIEGNYSFSLCISLMDGYSFWLTGVYGPSKAKDRAQLWEELYDITLT